MTSAYKIDRPTSAFALSSGKKRPRQKVGAHLAFIRLLPCLCCGTRRNIEAAHIRYGDLAYGKRETGAAEKPSDMWTVPLCVEHHRAQHQNNEREWWLARGIDPLKVASAIYALSGDHTAAEIIIARARLR